MDKKNEDKALLEMKMAMTVTSSNAHLTLTSPVQPSGTTLDGPYTATTCS